jgi:N-acetylmuramoyl-L-alanine amidase
MGRKYAKILAAVAVVIGFCFAVGVCVRALNAPVAVSSEAAKLSVVIDAGHGGIDGGVVGVKTKQKESDVNLRISFILKEKLADAGFLVVMTRTTEGGLYDTTAPGFKRRDMQKRKEICEGANPLCVISVHQNFYPSTSSRGGQVFYPKEDEWACRLAGNIQAELNTLYNAEGAKARKETAGDYYMLRLTPPSVIVECGFLSNPKDDTLLNTPAFCEKIADSIVAGLLATLQNSA